MHTCRQTSGYTYGYALGFTLNDDHLVWLTVDGTNIRVKPSAYP